MIRTIVAILLCSVALFAFTDSDLDGVDDSRDKCPNTPITDLVDANGCSVKSLITDERYDIIFGLSYSEINYQLNEKTDTYTTSFQADYYRGDFSLQFSTSYYTSSDTAGYESNGMNDTTVAGYYRWKPTDSLSLNTGVGVIFPTYSSDYGNNNTDYSLSANLSYTVGENNIFAGYIYTLIGDDDIDDGTTVVRYQNTNAYNVGVGHYFGSRLYGSISYYRSESIFEGVEDIENLTLYAFYSIDRHWFTTVSYAKGLSDSTSDNYLSLRVGYAF
ncbi:hypothetical protein NNO_1794 [Hydrogenimonas sp.]|nr:hypothetical protein NNO_1794 [Hydrogenimonas sp.]